MRRTRRLVLIRMVKTRSTYIGLVEYLSVGIGVSTDLSIFLRNYWSRKRDPISLGYHSKHYIRFGTVTL
jgi:hypothetical protein